MKWPPKTAEEFCNLYHVPVRDGEAIMFAAASLDDWTLGRPSVQLRVGETCECDCTVRASRYIDDDTRGIPVDADKQGARIWGRAWADDDPFKIFEVAVPLDALMVPPFTHGWARCSRLRVLRELREDEW